MSAAWLAKFLHEMTVFPDGKHDDPVDSTGIGTVKGKWVNIHLLVSPEDPHHLTELNRFLDLDAWLIEYNERRSHQGR